MRDWNKHIMIKNNIVKKALRLSKVNENFMSFEQKKDYYKKCEYLMEEIIDIWENSYIIDTSVFEAVGILSCISYKTPVFKALEFKNKVRQRFIKDIDIDNYKNNLCDYLIEHSNSHNEEETLKALDIIQEIK